ncbi:MAG: hypothetical protein RLY71_2934 [Pseudomonadota bacterium]|jgi:hypothetical protein
MNTLAALTGRVTLHPGAGLPAIRNSRPEIAARLAPGRRADELPELFGAIFTLCAHAHRHAARLAIEAARGRPVAHMDQPGQLAQRQALQLATARDQILRVTHDWPLHLPPAGSPGSAAHLTTNSAASADEIAGQAALLLRACPLWRNDLAAADRLAELPNWLEYRWLGMAPAEWLARFEADPADWPAQWARDTGPRLVPMRRLLRDQLDSAGATWTLDLPAAPLQPLDDPTTHLPTLARQMALQPGFCAEPLWHGSAADTGPWTRQHDPLRRQGWLARHAWDRLVSRIVDVLRLATPGGAGWLAQGSLDLGASPLQGGPSGLGWIEMARGLLLHWIELTPDGRHIAAARVLAPTEWNFHPHGVLAGALAALPATPAGTLAASARRLAVAFDPCVEIDVTLPAAENTHA